MASTKTLGLVSTAFVFLTASVVAVAGPSSRSPFASKKPKAWQQHTAKPQQRRGQNKPAKAANPYTFQSYSSGEYGYTGGYGVPHNGSQKAYPQGQAGGQYRPPQPQTWTAGRVKGPIVNGPQVNGPNVNGAQIAGPHIATPHVGRPQIGAPTVPDWAQQTYGQTRPEPAFPQAPNTNSRLNRAAPASPRQNIPQASSDYPQYDYQYDYPQPTAANQTRTQQAGQNPALRGASKPSWLQRLGLGNVQTEFTGHARLGAAALARSNEDTKAETIVDLDARLEASAITEGGLEYGAGVRVRAQRDRYRRGFGGRVGDCPATDPACASVNIGGNVRPIKGHTSQFYTSGPDDRRETEAAIEGAYLFMRSSYGDVTLGLDDGVASLFSLGAPSVSAVNASNSTVDYTGLDSVKTWNDASGFAPKISYVSPRLLGDQIGVGVQFGLSYAPSAKACGVDYCIKDNPSGIGEPFAPEIKNIFEAAVSLDRTFSNGFSAEITGTYARGSEDSGTPGFANLTSYGAGLEMKYTDFTLGTSLLKSNNGFAGQGDYTAYDFGLKWQPSKWGFSASYGHADDDLAKLTSDQAVLGLSYDLGRFTLGSGVQYITRTVPILTPTGRDARRENATAVFVEAGVDF